MRTKREIELKLSLLKYLEEKHAKSSLNKDEWLIMIYKRQQDAINWTRGLLDNL